MGKGEAMRPIGTIIEDQLAIQMVRQKKIQFYRFSELLNEKIFPRPEWIVDGLLAKGEFVICSATAKTGKSMLTLNLALSVASGIPFLGYDVPKARKVSLIQAEVSGSNFQE